MTTWGDSELSKPTQFSLVEDNDNSVQVASAMDNRISPSDREAVRLANWKLPLDFDPQELRQRVRPSTKRVFCQKLMLRFL